jgi:hypothetical protein
VAQASYGLRKELPMFHRLYTPRATLRALTGLDFGLRVRVRDYSSQRSMFCGAENRAARRLIADLAEDLSGLRVYSYSMRGQLEDTLSALQLNAEGGSWRYARRAASDLAGLLQLAAQRRLADAKTCLALSEVASRIAELCGREVR